MVRYILIGLLLNLCITVSAQESRVDSLEKILTASNSPIEKIDLLNELSKETPASKAELKLNYATQALGLSKRLDQPKYLMESYFCMGSAIAAARDFDKSLIYIDSSLSIARSIKDISFTAKDLSRKAWLVSKVKTKNEDSPEKLYLESLALYQSIDDQFGAAKSFNNLSWAYRIKRKLDESTAAANQALKIGQDLDDAEIILTAKLNLARVYQRKSDYKESIALCKDALEAATKIGSKDKQASINNLLSITLNKINQYEESIIYSNQALELYRFMKDTSGIGNSLLNKGVSYKRMGSYDKALEVYLESCKLMESQNNQKGVSNAYTNVGLIYKEMKDYDKAMEYLEKSLKIKFEVGDLEGAGRVYNSIGTTCFKQDIYDQALENYFKSYDLHKQTKSKNSQAIALVNIGEAYQKLQQFSKAFDYTYQSLALFNEVGSKSGRSAALNAIAETYMELKKYPEQASILQLENKSNFEIENMLIQSKDLAEEINDYSDLQTVYITLIEFYRNYDPENALVYQEKLVAIKDSVYKSEKLSTIAEMQARFEVDSKEKENEYLKENNALIKNRNSWYFFGSLALLGLLFAGLYYYLQLKKVKQKLEFQNTTIESQNEQLTNLNQTKDRFFGIIAHDLKSPLIAMQGLGKRINFLLRSNDQDQLMALGDQVDGTSTKLHDLLDNLLNWASIQTGDIPYHPQMLNLYDVAEDVVTLFENNADSKGIDLQMNIDQNTLIYADERAINTILRNLLSNAVKFTPKGGLIVLKSITLNQVVLVCLEDTGEGMGPNKLKELFTLNKKSTLGTDGEKGTGLGLVLCKELVELNHGELKVKSTKGKGSRFEFTLPLQKMQ